MVASEVTVKQAAEYLAANDPVLGDVIQQTRLCTIRPHKNYYQELVDSIIGQQLSIKAADSILKRFKELFGGEFPSPQQILSKEVEVLRGAGLSRAKAMYVLDLAQHVVDGRVKFDHLDNLSNDEVIKELTDIKGVGEWTAHMFLMSCMGRLDVLAHGDLGIKNGIQKLYGLKNQPDAATIQRLARKNRWHPYESVACWYVWQSLDNAPPTT